MSWPIKMHAAFLFGGSQKSIAINCSIFNQFSLAIMFALRCSQQYVCLAFSEVQHLHFLFYLKFWYLIAKQCLCVLYAHTYMSSGIVTISVEMSVPEPFFIWLSYMALKKIACCFG